MRGRASLLVLAVAACRPPAVAASAPRPPTPAAHRVIEEAPRVTLAGLLTHGPELLLTLHPGALSRDPVYGPLLRRASELAAAYAGPTNLGTTALAVLARTDEVVVAANDHGKEAVVVLRGVPADVDPLQVVDTAGKPIWAVRQGDLRASSRELYPVDRSDAALFVVGRVWLVATGPAIATARAAVISGPDEGSFAGDETTLLALGLPGDAIAQLHKGGLAPIGAGLVRVQLELMPGATGLIVGRLRYPDAAAAAAAEGTVIEVTLAFRHKVEQAAEAAKAPRKADAPPRPPPGSLDWLAAAKVEREGATLVVRAPIPHPWLDALARADVPAP